MSVKVHKLWIVCGLKVGHMSNKEWPHKCKVSKPWNWIVTVGMRCYLTTQFISMEEEQQNVKKYSPLGKFNNAIHKLVNAIPINLIHVATLNRICETPLWASFFIYKTTMCTRSHTTGWHTKVTPRTSTTEIPQCSIQTINRQT